MTKWIILAAIVILAAGCNSSGKKDPTQKEQATKQWNAARGAVLAGLAREQFKTGSLDKARLSINDAIKLEPQVATHRVISARIAIEQGQLELADNELKVAREADPKNADADYYSGVVFQRWQKPQEAFDAYQLASNKNPAELSYVLAASEMLVSLDRPADALGLLQEKSATFENSATLRDAIGQLLVQQGKFTEAIDQLRRASILANDDLMIREHLAMALFYGKQYHESGDVLARLIKDDSYAKRGDIFAALGECQARGGHTRDARASFDTAVRLQPGNGGAWTSLGRTALEMKDYDRAEIALKRALSLDSGSAEPHLLMGYLRLHQSRYNEALASFRKASAIDTKDTVGICMVGFTLERMGRTDQAIQFYGQALKLKPGDAFAAQLMAGIDVRE
jgi:tetratricopeptide (TPR) repeat protein